jgi:glycosyltransferase involved in cell wall biosynthesis
VLAGISAAVRELPALQLWCCFGQAPLLSDVRDRIGNDPQLTGRVHLLGRVPHEKIEQLMRAADIFVLGSHREGSGGALLEALACGLPPVVTDIPSFRMLTGDGKVGALWPCNQAPQLRDALQSIATRPRRETRVAVRKYFERELSIEAVGRRLLAAYETLIASRGTTVRPRSSEIPTVVCD